MVRERRGFLRTTAAACVAGAAWCLAPARALARWVKGKFPVRTVEKGGFDFDPANGRVLYKKGKSQEYRLVVEGLVEKPLSLTYAQLRNLPQVSQTSDFHCVEGWSVPDLKWGGFRFSALMALAKPKPEADHAVFHSLGQTSYRPKGLDHYVESQPVSALNDPAREMIFALDLNGQPLPLNHGAPLRLIAPFDLAYKSAKYITRIELTDKPEPGWWTRANPIYPIKAPVPRERLKQKK